MHRGAAGLPRVVQVGSGQGHGGGHQQMDHPQHAQGSALAAAKTVGQQSQIGEKLKSGKPHGNRAPDYDDWALNGDLLFWNDILGRSLELSSMGIRVDAEALDRQLKIAGADARRKFTFHQLLLSDLLPLTIGGGIGQSRLCMLMMECAHIGEVQSSVWDRDTIEFCERNGIPLL